MSFSIYKGEEEVLVSHSNFFHTSTKNTILYQLGLKAADDLCVDSLIGCWVRLAEEKKLIFV